MSLENIEFFNDFTNSLFLEIIISENKDVIFWRLGFTNSKKFPGKSSIFCAQCERHIKCLIKGFNKSILWLKQTCSIHWLYAF